jgi:hypothetical protein
MFVCCMTMPRTRCAPSPRHKRVYARLRRAMAKRSGERAGVRGHLFGASPSPDPSCGDQRAALSPQAGRGRNNDERRRAHFSPFQTAVLVPAARFLRPGFCLFASLAPRKGWRSAERRTDACEASVGPALSGQARHLARRLASPYGGRPPPGAHTVAILGAGAALPLTGIAAGLVTANSHVRVVVPGGGPLPPGATVANRRRGTPRLAPPSGCLRTTPLEEQG